MVQWIGADGVEVASVSQGVERRPDGRLAAVYVGRVVGEEPISRPRFTCVVDQIDRWMKLNRVAARKQML